MLSTLLFLVAASVNLLPGIGMLSASRLESLYGVAVQGPDLVILMRHRAVLLAIVGGILLVSALHPPLRPLGLAVGLLSMLSFAAIAWLVGEHNRFLHRVLIIDVVTSLLLVAAAALDRFSARGGSAA